MQQKTQTLGKGALTGAVVEFLKNNVSPLNLLYTCLLYTSPGYAEEPLLSTFNPLTMEQKLKDVTSDEEYHVAYMTIILLAVLPELPFRDSNGNARDLGDAIKYEPIWFGHNKTKPPRGPIGTD